MCECLCGEPKEHMLHKVKSAVLDISAYTGCRECVETFGIDVHAYTLKGAKEWTHTKPLAITPTEYGVVEVDGKQYAASFEIFSIEDIKESISEKFPDLPFGEDGYATLSDWFNDEGLDILQAAFYRCQKRKKEQP